MAEWDTSAIITKVLHSRPIKLFPLTRLPSQFRHMITPSSRLLELILALHRRDWHRWALRTVLLLMIFCSEKVHTNKVSWGGLCIRRWLSRARILPLWSLMPYFRLNRLAITLLIDDGNGVMILIAHGWLTSAALRQFSLIYIPKLTCTVLFLYHLFIKVIDWRRVCYFRHWNRTWLSALNTAAGWLS